MQQVLWCPSDDPVGQRLVLAFEVVEIAAGFLEVEGQQLHLCRAPAVERGLVCQHLILHIGHRRAAENQHQLGGILIFVDQELQGGGKAFGRASHIGVLIQHKDDPIFLCQLKHIFQRRLEGHERRLCRNTAGVLQDALAEVLQVLLGIALHAHEVDGFLTLDKLGQKGRLSHAAAAIHNGKLKLA